MLNIIIGAINGAVVCVIWALALNGTFKEGIQWGIPLGIVIGLFLYFYDRRSTGKDVHEPQPFFDATSISAIIAVVSIIIGLLVWMIRVIL